MTLRPPATFLGGAKSRLLPPSIPFRYFVAAVAFHVASWAVAAAGAADLPRYAGGPGLPLAALHLLTLGVLAMTAMGAAFQLLPVATKQPLAAEWPARLVSWLYIPGVAALAYGMGAPEPGAMIAGAILAAAGLAIFALLFADNLRRATSLGIVVAHGWAAAAALAALAVLGVLLALDFRLGLLGDHRGAALAHFILAAFGFMGLLALGFSYILVPMFALSPAPEDRAARTAFALAVPAVVLGALAALFDLSGLALVAAALGLSAAAMHLGALERSLRRRMKRRLGLSFALVRAAWAMLLLALVVAVALAAGAPVPGGATLFGLLVLVGWLLTFLAGILQRILPFLGSMHAPRQGGRAPLVSELTAEAPLRAHAAGHFAALALLAAASVLDSPALALAGTLAGLAGSLAFAWFTALLLRRMLAPAGADEPTETRTR